MSVGVFARGRIGEGGRRIGEGGRRIGDGGGSIGEDPVLKN